jgi:hypothetical protein
MARRVSPPNMSVRMVTIYTGRMNQEAEKDRIEMRGMESCGTRAERKGTTGPQQQTSAD